MDTRLRAVPILLIFEIWHMVIAERYVGLKTIGQDLDPRNLGLNERTACVWILGIFASWGWMVLLLLDRSSRMQGVIMIAVTGIGYSLRRNCGIKWVVIILMLEC